MENEIIYMLGVVAVGFALNFGLRALPFILFGGRNRELPAGVSKFSAYISPAIIAGLIVYSYAGSAWRTPWPYVAGAITVGSQVLWRNPLTSIIAGTVVYMILLNCCGCASTRTLEYDAQNPAICITTSQVTFGGKAVDPRDIPDLLEDHDVPKDSTIHIRLDPDVRDLKPARALMALLAHEGYKRPVLVTARHAESQNLGKRRSPKQK